MLRSTAEQKSDDITTIRTLIAVVDEEIQTIEAALTTYTSAVMTATATAHTRLDQVQPALAKTERLAFFDTIHS
jgi:hypothetical protein